MRMARLELTVDMRIGDHGNRNAHQKSYHKEERADRIEKAADTQEAKELPSDAFVSALLLVRALPHAGSFEDREAHHGKSKRKIYAGDDQKDKSDKNKKACQERCQEVPPDQMSCRYYIRNFTRSDFAMRSVM